MMSEKVQKKKKVILTIDTEGPRGNDPVLYQIWGKVGDEYYGVPKIIEICDHYGAKGLFFVDIPEIWDMGYEKIREVILYIREKGHDVGVHIHPHHMPNETRQFLFDYSKQEQYEIIDACTKKYIEITGEMPKCFRAGKYGANRDTLDILNELGYMYDFSEFYSQKWCGINPEIAYILPVRYKKLVEFPVTIFRSVRLGSLFQRYDKLEATNNVSESIHVLEEYVKTANEELIVLFLHSFSFLYFLDTPDAPTLNEQALGRFEKTMKYISESKDYGFIRESQLDKIPIVDKDMPQNIITTKGLLRQFRYLYGRAYSIRKTNKKAKLLVTIIPSMLLLVIFMIVVFIVL